MKLLTTPSSAHPSGFSNPPDCTPATPECSLSGGWNNDQSFFAFTRVGQYRDVMVQNGERQSRSGSPSSATARILASAGLRVLQVRHRGRTRPTSWSRPTHGAPDAYVGGMFVWNLNYQLAVPQTTRSGASRSFAPTGAPARVHRAGRYA